MEICGATSEKGLRLSVRRLRGGASQPVSHCRKRREEASYRVPVWANGVDALLHKAQCCTCALQPAGIR